MNNFFIQKLVISGAGKTDSIIEFSRGCNIIYGPSNTGKTYIVKCINYLFGSDENPIDATIGYDCITLVIKTVNGLIKLSRKLDKKKIEVTSTDNNIESGTYQLNGKYEKTLNSLWLRLIGIKEQHSIIKNEQFEKQSLTWRTFIHMFFLSEQRIIEEKSILLPITPNANTAAISAFLFLTNGNDFGDMTPIEDKKIKEAKKSAVVTYINRELSKLADRRGELAETLASNKSGNLNEEISKLIDEISSKEAAVTDAIGRNQQLLQELSDVNEQLAESNCLFSSYQELKSQYNSDIDRLSFIVDGEANRNIEHDSKCPFCDGDIMIKNSPNYIEASKAEYKKINLQLKDLEKATTAISTEKLSLEKKATHLLNEKNDLEDLINNELKPQIHELKEKLLKYREEIAIQNEIDVLKQFSDDKVAEIVRIESEEESTLKFKPKEHLGREILDIIDKYLDDLLELCGFENYTSVRFERESMDVVVNGKKKRDFGKGYCAFLNTIVSTVFCNFLNAHGKYSPGVLIFDSPILSLEEPDDKVSDSMKDSLFSFFVNNIKDIQIIMVENRIPSIDYKDSNIIKFTKNRHEGRYGLLNEVFD